MRDMGSSTCGFELREARKRIDYIIIMGLQLASRGQCGLVTYDDGLDGHRQSIELNRNSAVLSSCTSFELLSMSSRANWQRGGNLYTMGWQMLVQQSRDIVTGVLWNVRHNLNNDAVVNKIIKLIGSRGFQEDIIHLKPHDNKPPDTCELN